MQLQLDDGEVTELRALLDGALGELSHEIADTDNASFRHQLRVRRDVLEAVRAKLG